MSMMLMVKSFGVKVGNASRKLVLIKLADNANDKGECWPSYQHIADQCEISKRSAMKHIDALCEAGLIVKRSRKGVKGNSTNIYVLNLEGEISAPLTSEGEQDSPEGEESALGGEYSAPGGSEESAPGISHSFESVIEPVIEPVAPDAKATVAAGNVVAIRSADKPRCEIPHDMPGPKDPNAKTFKAWANYAMAYRRRYRVYPIWNQKTAGQVGQLVDRVGKELAPAIAAYYLNMNTQFYVTKNHPVGLLLADCEAIATQMQTGSQMTQTRARQMDSTQSNLSNVDEAKRLLASGWGDE